MGEVFRGVDTRLGRPIAVKTSREQFTERFNREARAISSLNHPHICTLYDVGPNYLVMELCEGETLAARLKRGKLSINDTLRYGQQIADALAAAHAKGITHRDLKPGNIMLGKSGVKVLDFGLAKSSQDETLTGARMVMGTPAYMAPEQREGKECDARTDIYSLGLVLYEMATGKRAVQNQIPSLDQLPERLQHVIERCLTPDPGDRWQSAQDVKTELEWAGQSRPAMTGERTRGVRIPWMIAALATLLAFVLAGLYWRQTPQATASGRSTRFIVYPPEKVVLSGNTLPTISPDGERLVFGGIEPDGKTRLFVRPLASLAAEPVPGSEGAAFVFWSPDSRSIGFFAGGKLKRSDLNGGPPEILCDASSVARPSGTWNRDGVILLNSEDRPGLYRIPATGGVPSPVTALDAGRQETMHLWPKFLPDGRHFIYLVQSQQVDNSGIYVASMDSKDRKRVLNISTNPSYAESPAGIGHLLFMQGSTLMAQAFDTKKLELAGERFPVAEQVLMSPAYALGLAAFSASSNGVLVYRTLHETTELVWFDRQGRRLGTVGEPGNYSVPALSPDEKTLAVRRTDTQLGTHDLWLFNLVRGTPSRFTFDPGEETNPTWSPDGTRIAFSSYQKGSYDLYQKAATGAGNAVLLMESNDSKIIHTWTPDGRFVLYGSGNNRWALPLTGEAKPMLLSGTGLGDGVSVSPNMKWMAYRSTESGRNEIYVQSFPSTGNKSQVSTAGGEEPEWRRDGKELFFVEGKRLMAVEVNTGPVFDRGVPKPLFEVLLETEPRRSRYQVAANGQKFLVNVPLESTQSATIEVVTNWAVGLKK